MLLGQEARISLMVTTLPLGTRRMTASTSLGAGMSIVPSPYIRLCGPAIFSTRGRFFLVVSFSRQDLGRCITMLRSLRAVPFSIRQAGSNFLPAREQANACPQRNQADEAYQGRLAGLVPHVHRQAAENARCPACGPGAKHNTAPKLSMVASPIATSPPPPAAMSSGRQCGR